jgi:SSS family solute:Na+ symporter
MSIWLCVLYYVPVSFLFFFIGSALYAFYGENPALILELKQQVSIEKNIPLEALKASDYGDRVLPFFMKTQIPTGFLGLLVAALMSAGMSTMSSGMNSSATVFLKDIYLQTLDKLKKSAVREQVVAGRKFNGVSFKSQPRLIHFKVILFSLWDYFDYFFYK